VKLDEIKKVKSQRPFLPFLVRIADGREIRVTHPDGIAWMDDNPRIVICGQPNGWEIVDVGLITSLAIQTPSQTA
jgi:hypothetical protein